MHRMKALGNRRRNQPRCQQIDHRLRHHSGSAPVPLLAHGQGNVEEQSLHLTIVKLAHRDIRPAIPDSKMRGIHVRHWTPQLQPVPQQASHRSKHPAVNGLIGGIVNQQLPHSIGGDRRHAQISQIRGLPGCRQAYQHNDTGEARRRTCPPPAVSLQCRAATQWSSPAQTW